MSARLPIPSKLNVSAEDRSDNETKQNSEKEKNATIDLCLTRNSTGIVHLSP